MTKDQALLALVEHYFNVSKGDPDKWDLGAAVNRLVSDHFKVPDEMGLDTKLKMLRARVIEWEGALIR